MSPRIYNTCRLTAAAIVLFWLPTFTMIGCGRSGSARYEVSGTVTIDGKPLNSGSILFSPLGSGPTAGGKIADGQFLLARDKGPTAGSYRVEILAYQPTGRQIPDPDSPGKTTEEIGQVIPARYNVQSELRAKITAAGTNHFEFATTGKKARR